MVGAQPSRQLIVLLRLLCLPPRCRLKGSELLQQLKLDERFVLYFHTKLTWHSPAATASGSSSGSGNGDGSGAPAGSGSSNGGGGGSGGPAQGSLSAQADVQVWSEVVGPFQAIPRGILQASFEAFLFSLLFLEAVFKQVATSRGCWWLFQGLLLLRWLQSPHIVTAAARTHVKRFSACAHLACSTASCRCTPPCAVLHCSPLSRAPATR